MASIKGAQPLRYRGYIDFTKDCAKPLLLQIQLME